MQQGNNPVASSNRQNGHHMAIFRKDGKYGPFLRANVEYRPDYTKTNQKGHQEPTSYFTIQELEADIAFRSYVLHRMYQIQDSTKALSASADKIGNITETERAKRKAPAHA